MARAGVFLADDRLSSPRTPIILGSAPSPCRPPEHNAPCPMRSLRRWSRQQHSRVALPSFGLLTRPVHDRVGFFVSRSITRRSPARRSPPAPPRTGPGSRRSTVRPSHHLPRCAEPRRLDAQTPTSAPRPRSIRTCKREGNPDEHCTFSGNHCTSTGCTLTDQEHRADGTSRPVLRNHLPMDRSKPVNYFLINFEI